MRKIALILVVALAVAGCEEPTHPSDAQDVDGTALGPLFDGTGEKIITSDPATQAAPAISGDRIVWQDLRNGNWDIYMYDLGIGTETQITDDPAGQISPDISGDTIVWADGRNGSTDIYLYLIAAGREIQITADPADQLRPAVSGDRVVWQDLRNGNWDIYMYDLGTGTTTRITDEPADQINPVISGDYIVWQDFRHDSWDIYQFDLGKGYSEPIFNDISVDETSPAVSGDILVAPLWTDAAGTELGVRLLSLNISEHVFLGRIAVFPPDVSQTVSGFRVVFVGKEGENWDIYLHELAGHTRINAQITADRAHQGPPAISGDRIVWEDDRNGNWDIYLYDLSVSPVTPPGQEVEVQPVDPSTESSPVTITFSEVTDGGTTSLETSGTGPPPPEGFKLGSPPVYFDVTTTADYSGVITVCIDYSAYAEEWFGGNENKERSLKLFHRETDPVTGEERWEDVTSYRDLDANIICGEVTSLSLFAGALDGDGPVTSNIVVDPNPVAANAPVDLRALIDDRSTGGSSITSAEYTTDDGASWSLLTAEDGTFDETAEEVSGGAVFPAPEVLDLCIRGTDSADNSGNPECILLAVYDPSGGFVTGGGWIESPAGAYKPDATLSGKATFGFVSKCKKGTTDPTGKTEFRFRAGDLNFQSTAYEWLVVTGSDYARFKGSGTINGTGGYRFMLWAGDGSPDTFRIRIWQEDESTWVETEVYDNGVDQALGGGSIVVHTN